MCGSSYLTIKERYENAKKYLHLAIEARDALIAAGLPGHAKLFTIEKAIKDRHDIVFKLKDQLDNNVDSVNELGCNKK